MQDLLCAIVQENCRHFCCVLWTRSAGKCLTFCVHKVQENFRHFCCVLWTGKCPAFCGHKVQENFRHFCCVLAVYTKCRKISAIFAVCLLCTQSAVKFPPFLLCAVDTKCSKISAIFVVCCGREVQERFRHFFVCCGHEVLFILCCY